MGCNAVSRCYCQARHFPSNLHQRNRHIRVLLLSHDIQGVVGVSPGVPVFSLKVLNSQQPGMLSRLLAAAQWVLTDGVKQGIRVVNISLSSYATPGSKVRGSVCSLLQFLTRACISGQRDDEATIDSPVLPAVCQTSDVICSLRHV
jgi:hypothetical protein